MGVWYTSPPLEDSLFFQADIMQKSVRLRELLRGQKSSLQFLLVPLRVH